MKRSVCALVCLAGALQLQAATAYRDAVLADHPAGYWRLNEEPGATNVVNSGSLGAAANGTPFQNVLFGVPGALETSPQPDSDTAANFDGNQSKIEIPWSAELNSTNFTIEVWARVAGGSAGVYRSPLASRDDPPQRGYIFYANPADQWQFWSGKGDTSGWDTLAGPDVQEDVWEYLVGTFDGTNKLFYVNGVLAAADQTVISPNAARPLRIAGSANEDPTGSFFFMGDIDEVAVYSKVLPQDRVLAHYQLATGSAPDASVAPAFALQPLPLDRFKGETANLQALVTGSLPLSLQWMKDGVPVPGATNMALLLTNLQPANSGNYTLEASNAAGTLSSDAVTLNVADVVKPVITQQPRPRTVLPGTTASFTVAATGSTTFSYQWQYNGTNISNATNATLTITNVQTANLGSYSVTVQNPAGSTASAPAPLQFPVPAAKSYALTVQDDKPVAYWRLGESSGDVAKDEAGLIDGTYLNGVTLGEPGALAGDTNTAAGFTSANLTKVDVPWVDTINPAVFTVECWAKITGGAGTYRSPVTSRADPQTGYILYAGPDDAWQFWTGTGAAVGWTTLVGPAVQPGVYAHLVGEYDGTNMFFYVNGVLAGQRTAVFGPNTYNPLRIGAGATEGDGDFFFQGDVDEVAIYNTALSEDRILAHYVAGFPLTTPPSISIQPAPRLAVPGGTAVFTVSASGGQPLNYQWKFNGQNITGATNSSLTLSNVTSAASGSYTVTITNAGGTVTSTAATLTVPSKSPKSYLDLVKGDGPVSYWRLGEAPGSDTAIDEMGANNGTYLNGVTLGVPGAIPDDTNTAASFAGATKQKMDVPWTDTLNPPQFTVEVWARLTGGSSYRSPLTSRADTPQRGYIFYAEPGNTWQFWTGKGDSSGWDSIKGPAVRTNQWTYLAATYDGTIKRFYVNGTEVGTSSAAFGPNDFAPLRLGGGASESDGNYFFTGDVDEAAVYNKALSPEQIILHYLASTKPGGDAVISIARGSGTVVLSWPAGQLQSAPAVTGPWTAVNNAASPYTVNVPAGAGTQFYRLAVP